MSDEEDVQGALVQEPPKVAGAYPAGMSGPETTPEPEEGTPAPKAPEVAGAYPTAPASGEPAEAKIPVVQMRDQPPVTRAAKVVYCPNCGMPPDFCDFDKTTFEKCKPWIMQNCPQYYPELFKDLSSEEQEKVKKAAADAAEAKPKLLPGGKVKKEEVQKVVIRKAPGARNKKKLMTIVSGLDTYGVKLDKAAKLFAKKFSCGCSVSKGVPGGKGEEIDIQGDFDDEILQVILENFKEVPKDKITFEAVKK
jgi:density-regulated protein DRP1